MSSCPQCGAPATSSSETLDLSVTTDTGTIARCLKLMRTNEPPQSSEMTYIRAVLSKTGAQLADMDDKILQLKAQLKHLEDERAVLAESHAENAVIMSAVRRTPPEVLAEIFSWTLPSSNELEGCESVRMKMEKSPWTLGQVSRRWRAIAILTPSLWSLVYVSTKPAANSRPMIESQIQRAHRLKVHFHGSEVDGLNPQIGLFQLLSEHATRWEELNVHITATLAPYLAALRGHFPALRKLWIRWDNPKSPLAVEWLRCFETAEYLAAVRMDYGLRPLPVFFPTHHLTLYRLRCPWDSHREILKLCPNILEAKIVVPFDSDVPWPEPDGQVINIPHLQHLFVSPSNILNYLRAPALTRIAIDPERERDDRLPGDLDDFLDRSSCVPRQLCLDGLPNVNITAGILNKYPFITSIILIFARGGRDNLSAAVDAHSTMLTHGNALAFPQLQEINFGARRSPAFPINYTLFLKMLQSRWTTLHAAGFLGRSGSGPDPVTLKELKSLRENGLNLSLGWNTSEVRMCLDMWAYGTLWRAW